MQKIAWIIEKYRRKLNRYRSNRERSNPRNHKSPYFALSFLTYLIFFFCTTQTFLSHSKENFLFSSNFPSLFIQFWFKTLQKFIQPKLSWQMTHLYKLKSDADSKEADHEKLILFRYFYFSEKWCWCAFWRKTEKNFFFLRERGRKKNSVSTHFGFVFVTSDLFSSGSHAQLRKACMKKRFSISNMLIP